MPLSHGFLPKTETTGTLVHAQGGGHKGCSAIDQATQQTVETEIIHLNQELALDVYLDLQMCFDLMVEKCHNLACRHHGGEDAYLQLHAKTHQLMHYYICHKFGVLKEYNTYSQHPWHGAGQGAADATLHYIVLSDTLINTYHTEIAPIYSMTQQPLFKSNAASRHSLMMWSYMPLHHTMPPAGPPKPSPGKKLLVEPVSPSHWWRVT